MIGNIKLANYQRARKKFTSKKTILYLPTWGGQSDRKKYSSANSEIIKNLLLLQEKFNIVTKMHPRTAYAELPEEKKRNALLSTFNCVFDASTPIDDLLNEADVVLSDLSSIAFDAVAGNVPLALCAPNEPVYYGGKLCLHQQLINDNIIPNANSAVQDFQASYDAWQNHSGLYGMLQINVQI